MTFERDYQLIDEGQIVLAAITLVGAVVQFAYHDRAQTDVARTMIGCEFIIIAA